jgi:hypothetical protein
MRISFSFAVVVFFGLLISACGGGDPQNKNVNTAVSNNPVRNTNNPLAVQTATPESTTNNAPTLTPVYKAYCAAMEKKDEASLRKIFSGDTIAYLDKAIKEDALKPPTIVKYFEDEQVTSQLCEVRNEQIIGNEGVAEVRTQVAPNGVKVIFVKEGGEWKLTNRSPTLKK